MPYIFTGFRIFHLNVLKNSNCKDTNNTIALGDVAAEKSIARDFS